MVMIVFNVNPAIFQCSSIPPIHDLFAMLKVFGLLALLSLSYSFECTEEGYNTYISKYTFKVEGKDQAQYKELDV